MHWSLRETLSDEVFETDTIIRLLNFKWHYFRVYARIECILLAGYVITIMWHSYYLENKLLLVILCLYCGFFFGLEVISLSGNRKIYFSDLSNVNYTFNFLLLLAYLILQT
jgi:hypothetical protein